MPITLCHHFRKYGFDFLCDQTGKFPLLDCRLIMWAVRIGRYVWRFRLRLRHRLALLVEFRCLYRPGRFSICVVALECVAYWMQLADVIESTLIFAADILDTYVRTIQPRTATGF